METMKRSRVARIKDGTARFKCLMCPYCVALCDSEDGQQNDYGQVTVQCPNCSKEFTLWDKDLQKWLAIDVA